MSIMDKAVFLGMSGAQNAMQEIQMVTNNLANSNTIGFKADYIVPQSYHVPTEGLDTRVYSKIGKTYTDFSPGPLLDTGRELDVSIQGEGFFAVQNHAGQESYTRSGNFSLNDKNNLVTARGDIVLGSSGAVQIPKNVMHIKVGSDGTISVQRVGNVDYAILDRLKLVKPDLTDLQKQTDGLFASKSGQSYRMNQNIRVSGGSLEGANVNPVQALTHLIDISRRYEQHANLMKALSENSSDANQLLNIAR